MNTHSRRELLQTGAKMALAAGLSSGAMRSANAIDAPKRTGGPRFKVGCCAYSYRQYLQAKTNPITLYDFLDTCAALNLDGVELTAYYFPETTPRYLARLKGRCTRLGLDISGTAIGNNFCTTDPMRLREQIDNAKRWVAHEPAWRQDNPHLCRLDRGGRHGGKRPPPLHRGHR